MGLKIVSYSFRWFRVEIIKISKENNLTHGPLQKKEILLGGILMYLFTGLYGEFGLHERFWKNYPYRLKYQYHSSKDVNIENMKVEAW